MALSTSDMRLLGQLVSRQTGVVIAEDKYELVQARLTRVAHINRLDSVDKLMHILHHRPTLKIQSQVAESLLTHETQFFREPQVFKVVEKLVVQGCHSNYQIWSAACSFGQEAYSLAIMIAESEQLQHQDIKILASDISETALDQARTGVYSDFELCRGLIEKQRRQHFFSDGTVYKINSNLQKKINFKAINLNHDWPDIEMMDMILLRNVLIYFDINTKIKLLTRIYKKLKPNGYLIVGTGETPDSLHSGFEKVQIGNIYVYKRQG